MALNLSQLPVEVLRGDQPAPTLRVSQLPVEVLRGNQPLPALRLSQLPVEVLRGPALPAGLYRVQATGRKSASAVTSVVLTFATPPAVGSGLIVTVVGWRDGGNTGLFSPTGCSDNRGHTYLRAITKESPVHYNATAIYYLPKVTASASPFTLTITVVGATYFEAAAIEVGGLGAGVLTLDQVAGQTGNSTAPTTTASPAVTADEVFVAAVHTITTNQGSNIVAVLSPPWVVEFVNLDSVSTIGGQGDTRVRGSALGTTQVGNWTVTSASEWAAVIAAFKTAVPGVPVVLDAAATLRVSTTALLSLPIVLAAAPTLRVSTTATLAFAPAALIATAAFALSATAALTTPVASLAVSQLAVEVLDVVPNAPLAATHLVVETLNPLLRSPLAATQVLTEHLDANPNLALVTAFACELLVIGQPHECLASPTPFPIDPD